MKYSEYQATNAYDSKHSGSAVKVVVYKASDPSRPLISNTTGINWSDDIEVLPVEEAGEEGVNEQVTGRISGAGTVNGFWSPKVNDQLPERDTFLAGGEGEEYTVMEIAGNKRIGQDLPLNVFSGVKFSKHGSAHGARGLKTYDLAFSYTNRQSGLQWATATGNI